MAHKIFDFRSTVTSCLVWLTSFQARTVLLSTVLLKVNNTNPACRFFNAWIVFADEVTSPRRAITD